MKAEIFSILVSSIWVILAKYYPSITGIYSWMFFPILFLSSEIFLRYKMQNCLVVPLSFTLICMSDYLARNLLAGDVEYKDEVGASLELLFFLITLITTTVALCINTYIRIKRYSIIQTTDIIGTSMLTNIVYIVAVAIFVLVIYTLVRIITE